MYDIRRLIVAPSPEQRHQVMHFYRTTIHSSLVTWETSSLYNKHGHINELIRDRTLTIQQIHETLPGAAL